MILLASTSDKLQVITGSVGTIDVHSSYVDITTATSVITPGRNNPAQITTAATTDVVAAPGSGIVRNLKSMMIRNAHATVANAITVQHTDGTNTPTLIKATLGVNESLEYNEGDGWSVRDTTGAIKVTNTAQPGQFLGATVLLTGPSATFTTKGTTTTIRLRMLGGGGAGGGCTSGAGTNGSAGGGGSGGYLEKTVTVTPSTGYTYQAGAGGVGASGAAGGNGGDSTFVVSGTTYTAKGGTGAAAAVPNSAATIWPGGAGGTASTNGDINGAGNAGDGGMNASGFFSGAGGPSLFGGKGAQLQAVGNGNNAIGYGSGGGGSCTGVTTVRTGGNGSAGVIIVEEYT